MVPILERKQYFYFRHFLYAFENRVPDGGLAFRRRRDAHVLEHANVLSDTSRVLRGGGVCTTFTTLTLYVLVYTKETKQQRSVSRQIGDKMEIFSRQNVRVS